MFGTLRDAIYGALRIHKGEGNQFFTHDGKQKLIETKIFFRKYVRLLSGLFVSAVSVSLAFILLIYGLIMYVVMPLIEDRLISLTVPLSDTAQLQFGQLIGFVLIFAIVSILSLAFIRRLGGAAELPQEERSRRCPMCGEQILEIAIRCKHCGSTVGRERTQSSRSSYESRPVRSEPTKQPVVSKQGRRPGGSRTGRSNASQDRRHNASQDRRHNASQDRRPSTSQDRRPSGPPSSGSSSGGSEDSPSRKRSTPYRGRRKGGRYSSGRDDQGVISQSHLNPGHRDEIGV